MRWLSERNIWWLIFLSFWLNGHNVNCASKFTRRKHFIVTMLPNTAPWVYKTSGPNGTHTYCGVAFEILKTLADFLNFDYEIKEPLDGQCGSLHLNGTWSGMIGQITRKEADFGIADFAITKDRFKAVHFMTSFFEDSLTFMIRQPERNKLKVYMYPFEKTTWYTIIGTIFLASFVLASFEYLSSTFQKGGLCEHSIKHLVFCRSSHFFSTFGYFVNQGNHHTPQKLPSRTFISCFWIVSVSIIATYSGNLIAFMTITKFTLPVDSLEKLAASPEYQAGVMAGSSIESLFRVCDYYSDNFRSSTLPTWSTAGVVLVTDQVAREKNASEDVYRNAWERNINVNPLNFVDRSRNSMLVVVERLRTEHYVYIDTEIFAKFFLSKEQICDIRLSADRFNKGNVAFQAYKGFPYLELFNRRIAAMVESGLVQHWMKQHLRQEDKCAKLRSSVGHFRSTLDNTVGAHVALSAGLSFASIAFIAEIISTQVIRCGKRYSLRDLIKWLQSIT